MTIKKESNKKPPNLKKPSPPPPPPPAPTRGKPAAAALKARLVNELSVCIQSAKSRFEMETGLAVSDIQIEIIDSTTAGDLSKGRRNYSIGHIDVTIK